MGERVSNSAMSLLTLLCRLVHHITHYVIYTCIFVDGSVHRAMPRTPGVIYIYILMTLYMYYPGCDVMMGARCTVALWHIECCYVWYICYIYVICTSLTVCHALCRPLIIIPIRFLQLTLSWCIFKVIIVNTILSSTQLLLSDASLQQLCGWLSVTPRALDPLLTPLPDCCGGLLLAVALPGDLC